MNNLIFFLVVIALMLITKRLGFKTRGPVIVASLLYIVAVAAGFIQASFSDSVLFMGAVYDPDATAHSLEMRNKLMSIRAWKKNPWLEYIDFVSREPTTPGQRELGPVGDLVDGENVRPASRAAIKIIEDFKPKKGGGYRMMFPVEEILKGNPAFGDRQIVGTGEKITWAYEDLSVNQVRKPLNVSGGNFNKFITAEYVDQIAGNAQPKLEDWFRRFLNADIKYGILEGRSLELTQPRTNFGLGQARVVHPNIYMASGGWVGGTSYSGGKPGSAGYETDVEAAFNSLTSADKLTGALLEKLQHIIVSDKNIEPSIENKYGVYYPLILPSAGIWQLKQDPYFQKLRTEVQPFLLAAGGKDQRELDVFNGAAGIFGCFIIREDNQFFKVHTNANPGGWDNVAAGTVRFGPQWKTTDKTFTPMLNSDSSSLCVGVVVGRDMMYGGLGSRLEFTNEIWDHKNQEEAAGRMVMGFRRTDAIDRDGFYGTAGEFAWHQGSALIGFHAPPLA